MLNTNEVRIETSTICNYRCKFCPYAYNFHRKKEIMSFELFRLLAHKVKFEAPRITDLTISGFGEAFLDESIMKKIECAKKLGYNIHILTNGSLLTKKIIKKLYKLKVEDIRFSLHTVNKDHYKKITGATDKQFKTVLKNIWYAINLDMNVIITADIIEENKNDIEKMKKYFKGTMILLEIWKPHNWVDWGHYRDGERVKKTCGRPFNGPLQIQVDGTINACCFDYEGKLIYGDFKIQSLNEIFHSEFYTHFAEEHKKGITNTSPYICKNCDQLKDVGKILLYNNKFSEQDRVGKTSTNYRSVEL